MVKSAALFCSQTVVRDESDFLFSAFSAGSTPTPTPWRHCVCSLCARGGKRSFRSFPVGSWRSGRDHYYFTGETDSDREKERDRGTTDTELEVCDLSARAHTHTRARARASCVFQRGSEQSESEGFNMGKWQRSASKAQMLDSVIVLKDTTL